MRRPEAEDRTWDRLTAENQLIPERQLKDSVSEVGDGEVGGGKMFSVMHHIRTEMYYLLFYLIISTHCTSIY